MQVEVGQHVRLRRAETVMELTIANPPVNALTHSVARAMADALTLAAQDDAIQAVVLRGSDGVFSTGIDIRDLEDAALMARLGRLCSQIEAMPKPVLALVEGEALGAGLELALAAHDRIATPFAAFGLPEVTLGLIPSAGATQRLPRLVGATQALRMIGAGITLGAVEARGAGLISAIVETAVDRVARQRAVDMAGQPLVPTADRRDGMQDGRAYMQAVTEGRAQTRGNRLPAAAQAVACVEAAMMFTMEQGLAFEQTAFNELMLQPESAGLRHAFVAERLARRAPAAVQAAHLPPPQYLGIWGASGPAAELAQAALRVGMHVAIADPAPERLESVRLAIETRIDAAIGAGQMSAYERASDLGRLDLGTGAGVLADAQIMMLTRNDLLLTAPVVLMSIGPKPARGVVGVTYLQGVVRLAEMVVGPEISAERAAMAYAFGARMGWLTVPVGPGGPVTLRMATALSQAVAQMAGQGVAKADIAAALSAYGIAGNGRPDDVPPQGAQIARRVLAVLANTGAQLLSEGVVHCPAQIDAIVVAAGMMARWTGGPMYQADRRGLLVLRQDLRDWMSAAPALCTPDPMINSLIADGQNFAGLDLRYA